MRTPHRSRSPSPPHVRHRTTAPTSHPHPISTSRTSPCVLPHMRSPTHRHSPSVHYSSSLVNCVLALATLPSSIHPSYPHTTHQCIGDTHRPARSMPIAPRYMRSPTHRHSSSVHYSSSLVNCVLALATLPPSSEDTPSSYCNAGNDTQLSFVVLSIPKYTVTRYDNSTSRMMYHGIGPASLE
jgi:hypothetical protein